MSLGNSPDQGAESTPVRDEQGVEYGCAMAGIAYGGPGKNPILDQFAFSMLLLMAVAGIYGKRSEIRQGIQSIAVEAMRPGMGSPLMCPNINSPNC